MSDPLPVDTKVFREGAEPPTVNKSSTKESCIISAGPTPLPKVQLALLLYLQLAEPITSTVIYPFVNQLVRRTGITKGDDDKTGYFVGAIVSVGLLLFLMHAQIRPFVYLTVAAISETSVGVCLLRR